MDNHRDIPEDFSMQNQIIEMFRDTLNQAWSGGYGYEWLAALRVPCSFTMRQAASAVDSRVARATTLAESEKYINIRQLALASEQFFVSLEELLFDMSEQRRHMRLISACYKTIKKKGDE